MEITLIEHNKGDVLLIEHVLRECFVDINLKTITTFEGAISYLSNLETSSTRLFPDLIILPLSWPSDKGIDILRKINSSTRLKQIPVSIFTPKDEDMDIRILEEFEILDYKIKSFDLDVLCYSIKELIMHAQIKHEEC